MIWLLNAQVKFGKAARRCAPSLRHYILFLCAIATFLATSICGSDALKSTAWAQPAVTHATPAAILPTGPTRIVVHGDKLTSPVRVWTNGAATASVVDVQSQYVTLDIKPRDGLPLGPFGLWIATNDGIAPPLTLLVDELPSIAEQSNNHEPLTAQTIGLSAAVDASSDGKVFDYFRLHADKGQELTFEILAQHIGSTFDPVVRLLTASGEQLVHVDDEATSPDCRFRHRFEQAGAYLLEVHDNRFVAGGRYRLRVGNFPLIAFAYPPVVQRAACVQLKFAGADAQQMATPTVSVPDDPQQTYLTITAPFAEGGSATWTAVRIVDQAQFEESEPNDGAATANTISAAHGINGLLAKPGDRDFFKLSVSKGETWRFAATSRSFGSPTLLKMTLRNAQGAVLGKTNVTDGDEWQFDVKFADDAEAILEVEDLLHRGGPDHGYHVSIGPPDSFTLSLKPDAKTRDRFAVEATRGAVALDVVVKREGYNGPIKLDFAPSQSGALRIVNDTILADAKEARIYIVSEADWSAEAFTDLKCIGRSVPANDGDAPITSRLSTTALLAARAPHVPFPPAWQDGMLLVAGVRDGPPLLDFSPTEPVAIARTTPDATLTLAMKRSVAEYKDSPVLIDSQLPDQWTATAKADKDNMVVALKRPLAVTSDAIELKFVWYAEHNGRGQVITTSVLATLFDPLQLKMSTLEPMKAGDSQKVIIDIVRAGSEPQPVTLQLQNLPAGVAVSESLTIPANESKLEFDIVAGKEAAASKTDQFSVVGQTKFGAHEVMARTKPATLEILAP